MHRDELWAALPEEKTDLIMEGITTSSWVPLNSYAKSEKTDLIMEGITTSFSIWSIILSSWSWENWPDYGRDYDLESSEHHPSLNTEEKTDLIMEGITTIHCHFPSTIPTIPEKTDLIMEGITTFPSFAVPGFGGR